KEDLATKLRQKAFALGFELFGVAKIQNVPEIGLFEKWLDNNYAGDMTYLERNKDKRKHPEQIVENAKSVIVCAANYHTKQPLSIEKAPKTRCWISRYAWGDDYHDVLKKKISALYEYLVEQTSGRANGRYYVDTGPVLEKVWAKYAGVGWIGKNTCLINKQKGSFFFLAVIISDFEPGHTEPATDHCGSCTRCIDACPTNALVAPYVLDANLCISYLTIEKRGSIPVGLRDKIGRQVFGCDICQDVCPWIRKAPAANDAAFLPRDGFVNPDLVQILGLNNETFSETFRHSPVKRTKYHGIIRNALIAAGNSGAKKLAGFVKKYLHSNDEILREHAIWALNKLSGKKLQTGEECL
ncbi:MAG: tRNA epoxyqueuosine(34) reductase QueG, partial [bacterium]